MNDNNWGSVFLSELIDKPDTQVTGENEEESDMESDSEILPINSCLTSTVEKE